MPTFPLECPRSLRVSDGSHPTRTYRTQSGATRTRLFGSLAVGTTISGEWLCTDAQAAQVTAMWYATYSGAQPITLPPEMFRGAEETYNSLPAHLKWYMKEPQKTVEFKGHVTLTVEFEGRLEV